MCILFISLGCDKNLVDSEIMLSMLKEKGFTFTDNEEEAEIVIVNTCCFINDAKEESINTLLEMAERKDNGQLKVLIAAGCLAQRYQEEIQKEIPQVDAIVGTTALDKITEAVEKVLEGKKSNYYQDINRKPLTGKKRIITTGGYYAYLKIAEGCDKHCTYCIIPRVRGKYRSVPMENLLQEAKELAEKGVKELILVAQETTLYGMDLYGKKSLPTLLHKLAQIEKLEWIRILYCYPEEITEELIETIQTEPKVCHYLDIPIQHSSDKVLKRMGRHTNQQELRKIIDKLREKIPDICLRTTLITGFPGETEQEHKELMQFIKEIKFDRLGVFCYSQEEDTPAASMEEQIKEEIKEKRQMQLMELQQEIAFKKAREMVGKTLKVIVEGKVIDEDAYVARTYRDAPDVDGYLFFNTDTELITGDFVEVTITGSNEYDLLGERV